MTPPARDVAVRREIPADIQAIADINEKAFGQPAEARLIEAMRRNERASISLVAAADEQIVGHILFTPVTLEGLPPIQMMGLGPMAVLPAWQRRGIGSQLVTAGLDECTKIGCKAVVVVGHVEYYPRFGFVSASRFGLRCEYGVPDDVFMVRELTAGALAGRRGTVRYLAEFGDV